MKPLFKFILIYFACFSIVAIVSSIFLLSPNDDHSLGYTIAGCFYYVFVGSVSWLLIYSAIRKIKNSVAQIVTFTALGFIMLNSLVFYTTEGGHARPMLIPFINIIHLASFIIAYIAFIKTQSKVSGKQ